MTASNSLSIARILAAPWHQRRNQGGLWILALVIAACLLVPVMLFWMSLLTERADQAAALRTGAGRSTWIGLFALPGVGWALLVGNVLQQNHPTLARLVPQHPGQLRTALLVAWAMVSLAGAALPGFAMGAPLAWGSGMAGGLALFAAGLRWPRLWLAGIAAPFVVHVVTTRFDADGFGDAISARWTAHAWLWTAVVATAGALILVTMIGGGGARHRASYESRQRLGHALRTGPRGPGDPTATSALAWLHRVTGTGHLYRWWLARLLARADSPVMSRLLAGLGPSTHWTSRVTESLWFVVVSGSVCLAIATLFGGVLPRGILPWISYSVLTGLCTNALQAVPRLRQTRREQALLVLLPGVPRGARLNRWLAGQMSAVFLVSAACAFAMAWGFNAWADSLDPGVVARVNGGMTAGIAAALLPQVAWQWRQWARLRGDGMASEAFPVLAAVVMGLAVLPLHALTGVGYLRVGVMLAVAAALYCAWRWHRMASEPTAFPVGRLA